MSDFEPTPIDPAAAWPDVPTLSTEALLLGGALGPLNAQAVALAARTKALSERIASLRFMTAIVVDSIEELRFVNSAENPRVFVSGYYEPGDGGGGEYWFDDGDTTTTDNGGTVIVDEDGGRWKLALFGNLSIRQFGAKGDGSTDDTAAIQSAIDSLTSRGGRIDVPDGTYMAAEITLKTRLELVGSGRNNATIRAPAGSSPAYVVGISGSAYNMRIRGLDIDGNGVASKGISIIGSSNGSNAHHIIEDVAAHSCLTNAVHLRHVIYGRLVEVYAHGGLIPMLLEDIYASTMRDGLVYNGSTYDVHMVRCSDFRASGCAIYNDPLYPVTYQVLMDACFGCTWTLCEFEPQGAANVTSCITINDDLAGNSTDNVISFCRFIGLTYTKVHDIIIGASGSAYKTKLLHNQHIKPTSTASIKLTNQANTEIIGCVDLAAYDTPVHNAASVQNDSSNNWYTYARMPGSASLPSSYEQGSWTPSLTCGTSGAIVLSSPADSMTYTRIGNRIFVSGRILVSSVSSPVGDLMIAGLPFSTPNSTSAQSAMVIHATGLLNSPDHTSVHAFVGQNGSVAYIRGYLSGNQVNTMAANIQAGTTIVISGSYQAI